MRCSPRVCLCTHMYARLHDTRASTHTSAACERYDQPKAGVSLICLMSRYCNDFASDLRLFIYSPAVLADRTLITGASRYTNGIKVPASAHTQSTRRHRVCASAASCREFRGRVSYGGDLSSTRSRR